MRKRRSLSIILTFIMMCCLVWGTTLTVRASDEQECVGGSYLTHDELAEVTVNAKTKGIYLKSGSSILNKLGTGYLSAGGNTVGQIVVSKISVAVRIERLVNGSWVAYTSLPQATNYNSAYVSTSKAMYVPTGYYYRVCSAHYANSDVSTSFTNGLYI